MRERRKNLIKTGVFSLFLMVSLMLGGIPSDVKAAEGETAGENHQTCTVYTGTNVESQNYSRWTNTIKSYLTATDDGNLIRVQYGSGIEGILVECYDTSYRLLSTKLVDKELAIFGGFYATDTNYFLLTGQSNSEERADVEVYRITKYDKEWNRIASVGLYDCNTTVPFDAGSARMDAYGRYLLIRTCHEMYQSSDGLNHQANVTIQVDMESMEITDSYTGVMNNSYGYVSHSFNQFIRVEDGHIMAVDHGDAYPRSIALLKYQTDVTTGKFVPSYSTSCKVINVLSFEGNIGENTTGASVGGFEISDSSYLIAGNSVIQDEDNLTRTTRNVFVASVNKDTDEVSVNWITDYEEGEQTTHTPQLVKIDNNRYVLLWTRNNIVYYTGIDGNGNRTGDIYSLSGNLSDCVPVVINNKLVWYTWKNETTTFYEIALDNLSQSDRTVITNGHRYESTGITDGYATLVCKDCKDEQSVLVATSMSIYWNTTGNTYTTATPAEEQIIGGKIKLWINGLSPSGANNEMEIIVSDPSVLSYSESSSTMGTFTMLKEGTATVTIRPKWNPDVERQYTFSVSDHAHEYEYIGTEDGIASLECSICHKQKEVQAATGLSICWNDTGGITYSSSFNLSREIGDELYYWGNVSPSGADSQIDVNIENPEILSCTPSSKNMGKLTTLKTGKTKVTFSPTYNPSLTKSYTITVNGDLAIESFAAAQESPQQVDTEITLNAAAVGGDWSYVYKFYEEDADGNRTVIQDYSSSASCRWSPVTAGTRTVYVEVKDGQGTVVTESLEYTITKKELTASNFIFIPPAELSYDGTSKEAIVMAAEYTGACGNITIEYYGEDGSLLDGAPILPGNYKVKINVSGGDRYDAVSSLTDTSWNFTIEKGILNTTDFVFAAPENAVYDNTVKAAKIVALTNLTGIGDIVTKYYDEEGNLLDGVPTESGRYTVKIDVTEGSLYGERKDLTDDSWNFTIEQAADVPGTPETSVNVSHALKTVNQVKLPENWIWDSEDGAVSIVAGGTVTAKAQYVGLDKRNYKNTIVTVVITADSHIGGEATCTKLAICNICGEEYGALDEDNHSGETVTKNAANATCVEKGYTGDLCCADCGAVLKAGEIIPINPDNHTGKTIIKNEVEATCAKEGYTGDLCCADCDALLKAGEIIPMNPDNHTGETVTKNVVKATCIAEGYTGDIYCEDCQELIKTGEILPIDENAHEGGTVTCTKQAICDICGEPYGEVDSNNHTGEKELRNEKKATCVGEGYSGDIYCMDCENIIEKGKVTAKTEHIYQDGKCIVCGTLQNNTSVSGDQTSGSDSDNTGGSMIGLNGNSLAQTIEANSQLLNMGAKLKWKGTKLVVSWGKVAGASGYEIYAAKTSGKLTCIKTLNGNKTTSLKVKKILGKKLNTKSYYKVCIKAYQMVNGQKIYVGTSYTLYTVGKSHTKFTNVKKVAVPKKIIFLNVKKTISLKAKTKNENSKKKLLKKTLVPNLRYFSTNAKVAAVSSKGTVKAVGKGSCRIYIIASNGIKTKVNVRVR